MRPGRAQTRQRSAQRHSNWHITAGAYSLVAGRNPCGRSCDGPPTLLLLPFEILCALGWMIDGLDAEVATVMEMIRRGRSRLKSKSHRGIKWVGEFRTASPRYDDEYHDGMVKERDQVYTLQASAP